MEYNNWENLLIYKKSIPKNVTFYTKKELSENFVTADMYEIAYKLEFLFYRNYELDFSVGDKEVYDYLDKLENYDYKFLQNLASFMIIRGLVSVYFLVKKYDLDTSKIGLDLFINGIKSQGDKIFSVYYFNEFISLYNKPEEIVSYLLQEGKILIVYELILSLNLLVEKIEFNEDIYNKFSKFIKNKTLFDKLTIYGYLDWNHLSNLLFTNGDYAYGKIKEMFSLNDEEKDEFEILKQKHFFTLYKEILKDIKQDIEKINFSVIGEYTFTDIYDGKMDSKIEDKIRLLTIEANIGKSFIITFINIVGQQISLTLSNGDFKQLYSYNLLQKEQFYNDVLEVFKDFKSDLEKNNLDFTIFISKSNPDKDNLPNEEEFKRAA